MECTTDQPDYPLLRIFDFNEEGATQLKRVLESLANGQKSEITLTDIPNITGVNGCRLILKAVKHFTGIRRNKKTGTFTWREKKWTWDNHAGLVEPFCTKCHGHQYLGDVVLSADSSR